VFTFRIFVDGIQSRLVEHKVRANPSKILVNGANLEYLWSSDRPFMIFGQPTEFGIEAYHEPAGSKRPGFGRMAIDIQGTRIGDILEEDCSLFHAADKLREIFAPITNYWDESFNGLSDREIFSLLDDALYIGGDSQWERYGRFDFLTNTGEQFDNFKTFIMCRPDQHVLILYQAPDDSLGSGSCSLQLFCQTARAFVQWFDEQVQTAATPSDSSEGT
jgi:hypothetical protein